MSSDQPKASKNEKSDQYAYFDPDECSGRPKCISCSDPVKVVHHSGKPMFARHCRDCYAELMHGVIPKMKSRRVL